MLRDDSFVRAVGGVLFCPEIDDDPYGVLWP
jgi:hypothetical protein